MSEVPFHLLLSFIHSYIIVIQLILFILRLHVLLFVVVKKVVLELSESVLLTSGPSSHPKDLVFLGAICMTVILMRIPIRRIDLEFLFHLFVQFLRVG